MAVDSLPSSCIASGVLVDTFQFTQCSEVCVIDCADRELPKYGRNGTGLNRTAKTRSFQKVAPNVRISSSKLGHGGELY